MLKGISPLLSPRLLATLCRMGHGDEIVLADAHFPGASMGRLVLRADGVPAAALLDAILPLFELDTYAPDPVVLMAPAAGDAPDPDVESDYRAALQRHVRDAPEPVHMDRQAFYERAKSSFAVVMTGELRKYGNVILKKGVTPTT